MTGGTKEPATIAVAICTYKRNDLLTRLLEALTLSADRVRDRATVGVVLVDDTPEGQARPVANSFAGIVSRLGCSTGYRDVRIFRWRASLAIETAMELADWTAITDDDCEPPPEWLEALLDLQRRTGADAVTGRMKRRVPDR